MPTRQRMMRVTILVGVALLVWAPVAHPQDGEAVSAKTWLGYEAEIEEYMKTAEILGLEDIPVGVTNPQSADLAPGWPIDRFVWKQL